ncbi:MAG: TonB family protein [Bacillota bacterium]
MWNRNEPDHLFLFITVSIVIHFVLFILIPYGSLNVMGNNEGAGDYEFIQMVEYRTESIENSKSTNINNDTVTEKTNQNNQEDEIEEELIDEPQDEEVEIENQVNEDVKEEARESEETNISEETNVQEQSGDSRNNSENVQNTEETAVDNEENITNDSTSTSDNDIISSEDSDMEVNVSESKNTEETPSNDTDNNNDNQNDDTDNSNSSVNEDSENNNVATEEEETTPPLPTAGELTLGAPRPAYPKDLVGQAVSGVVLLRVHVSSSGEVETIRMMKTSGIEQMDRVASKTVELGWDFKQYKQPYAMDIRIEYTINENGNPRVSTSQGNLVFK